MAPVVSTLVSGLLVSLVGAGVGYGAAAMLAPSEPVPASEEAPEPAAPDADVAAVHLTDLPPLLSNLAHPRETWVRVELVLLSDAPLPAGDAERVGQDLLAFLRSVRLDQLEGPSGFLTLREEFDARAALRTQGRAKRVLLRTLLFE